MATQGTCDIFSTIVDTNCLAHATSNPYGLIGTQSPRTGSVMAGFVTMDHLVPFATPYREYLSVKLDSPLEVGNWYEASAYISLEDYAGFATNSIGFYFSEFQVNLPNLDGVLNLPPQVNETRVISDTANWVKIEGVFEATLPFNYMTIGNFFNDSSMIIQRITSTALYTNSHAYYFIDDVVVQEFHLRVSRDTTLCLGDSVELFANIDSIIGWAVKSEPNTILSTNPRLMVSPTESTTYLAYTKWDTAQATVEVFIENPLNLGRDTTICLGELMVIDASISNAEYLWQDGSMDSMFVVNKSQTYWVEVSHPCGIFYDTISIDFIDCQVKVAMPNVFSPNNDGINDYFLPIRIENNIYGDLSVFNRHGQKVYDGSLDSKGWDGSYNGQPCTEGVYYWVLTYFDQTGISKMTNGHLTLTR